MYQDAPPEHTTRHDQTVSFSCDQAENFLEHTAARAIWWFRYHESRVGVQDTSGMAVISFLNEMSCLNERQESPEEILVGVVIVPTEPRPGTLRSCFGERS